jgi:hypothetical protein
MKRSQHRVTVWAGGVKGWPVSCACGWKAYAATREKGYAMKRAHEAEGDDTAAYRAFVEHLRGLSEDELDNERYTYEHQPQFAGTHELSVDDRLGAVRDEMARRAVARLHPKEES